MLELCISICALEAWSTLGLETKTMPILHAESENDVDKWRKVYNMSSLLSFVDLLLESSNLSGSN